MFWFEYSQFKMRYLRVKYIQCKWVLNVPENFVEDWENLDLEENQEQWVFWSSDSTDTPARVDAIDKQINKITSVVQTRQGTVSPKGWYRARILLIRGK